MMHEEWPPPRGWRADRATKHDTMRRIEALCGRYPDGVLARDLYRILSAWDWTRGMGQSDLRALLRAGVLERVGVGEMMRYRVAEDWRDV